MEINASSGELNSGHVVRDVALGVIVIVLGAAIMAFANIPTRTSVLESRVDTLERGITAQLADIQARLPR